ncbi:MAG TPA: OB-fold domain-containing protein [Mycobacterium sp.]|nr:OB-fold domain-containing protein [Mycobacterium sp.]
MTNSFAPPPERTIAAENFLTDGARAVLRVTRCRDCGSAWFPARAQCSTCASRDTNEELTSTSGIAYASSVVRVGPPGFAAPYVLAYVDVDGVRVLAHTQSAEALTPGTPVELRVAAIGADEDGPLWSYAVAPTTEGNIR